VCGHTTWSGKKTVNNNEIKIINLLFAVGRCRGCSVYNTDDREKTDNRSRECDRDKYYRWEKRGREREREMYTHVTIRIIIEKEKKPPETYCAKWLTRTLPNDRFFATKISITLTHSCFFQRQKIHTRKLVHLAVPCSIHITYIHTYIYIYVTVLRFIIVIVGYSFAADYPSVSSTSLSSWSSRRHAQSHPQFSANNNHIVIVYITIIIRKRVGPPSPPPIAGAIVMFMIDTTRVFFYIVHKNQFSKILKPPS
jgi:hypothetical protein